MPTTISVIATVKNEGEALRRLLDSLTYQTLLPSEVVICDGGSTDNTIAILREYQAYLPLKIVEAPGSNISAGRNRAIAAAAGPIIAVTDAGVTLSPLWVEALTQPIRNGRAEVVSGWFEPDPFTDFEVVMGATVLPDLSDIEPDKFLPSSRSVAFTRRAWEAAGGYPEWLDYCEDLIFDLALRKLYGPFPFAPKAVAYFRPRGDMYAFARQYFYYARGDGKADLWRKRHALRYGVYLLLLPFLLWQIALGRGWAWAALVAGTLAYSRRPFQRLWNASRGWSPAARLWGLALVVVMRLVGDAAKMAGYPVGVRWRLRQTAMVRSLPDAGLQRADVPPTAGIR